MSLVSAVRTAAFPSSRCAVTRDVRRARPRVASHTLSLRSRKPSTLVTRRSSERESGTGVEVDDVPEASSSARDESLECVVVGMEATCVLSEDEDDVDGVCKSKMDDENSVDEEASALLGLLGGIALVSPFFLWGTSMVAMKEVLPATSPLFVASVRLVPAGLVLIAWAASQNRPWPKGKNAWLAISLFALIDGTAFQGCLSEGLQRTSAGLGSVIIDSQPLTVAVLASIIYGETLAPAGVAGLGLGVVGLLMLELPQAAIDQILHGDVQGAIGAVTSGTLTTEGGLWDSGEWWMLLAAQSMAVGTVMVRWVCKYVDPVMATGWHMAIGGVPLLAYSIANEPQVYSHLNELQVGEIGGLLYTSLLGSALAYGLFFYFASKGSLTKLSSLTFLTPMFAAVFGYFLLDETLNETQLLGALVTVVGIYLVNTRASEGKEVEE
ncbi:DMT family transporter [bacterium]|nr:DMT family transporter [bacterium]